MKVEVTQRDCDTGLTRSYTLDSVAKAIKRAVTERFKEVPQFQVLICTQDYVFINGRIFDLPDEVMTFIAAQDNNKPVSPMTFELPDLPDDFFQKECSHA